MTSAVTVSMIGCAGSNAPLFWLARSQLTVRNFTSASSAIEPSEVRSVGSSPYWAAIAAGVNVATASGSGEIPTPAPYGTVTRPSAVDLMVPWVRNV